MQKKSHKNLNTYLCSLIPHINTLFFFFPDTDLSALLALAFQDVHILQIICSWELLVTSSIDVACHPEVL